jgi:hypothetical protein
MVYQEPMILQWDKVVTVIPLTINSQDKYDKDYIPGPQDEEKGYDTASAQQEQMGGAQRRGRAPRTSTKWPSDTMIVSKVYIVGMPVPLTEKCRFRALARLVARQKIPLNLPELKELSSDEKWDLFDKHVHKHLKFQEDAKPQAFKLFWKMATKAWRQFRFQLRQDFIKKGLEPFTRHPFIVPKQWKEFMKQEETEQTSSASVKFKELRSRNTSEHNMGPAGYTVKLEQWEEEDRQLATAGIPNPYDAYPDDLSKNWLRARNKLVIKDCVAMRVFNNKEVEKLAADIMEKIACAESSGMAGQREYEVLSQCLGLPEQPGHVRGVSSYQGWKYAWPQHVEKYRKRKRTKTNTSVDTEKIKEKIKQEQVVEMHMQRWCCHQCPIAQALHPPH